MHLFLQKKLQNLQQSYIDMYGGSDDYFEVISETHRRNRKFNCMEQIVEFRAVDRPIQSFTEAITVCQNFVRQIHLMILLNLIFYLKNEKILG